MCYYSIRMYYDGSRCIMSNSAHVRRNAGGGPGAKPLGKQGGLRFGGPVFDTSLRFHGPAQM